MADGAANDGASTAATSVPFVGQQSPLTRPDASLSAKLLSSAIDVIFFPAKTAPHRHVRHLPYGLTFRQPTGVPDIIAHPSRRHTIATATVQMRPSGGVAVNVFG